MDMFHKDLTGNSRVRSEPICCRQLCLRRRSLWKQMEEDVAVDAVLLTVVRSDLRNFSVVLKDSQI